MPPAFAHSESATIGSIRVARRAGSAQATTATAARIAVTATRTSGSAALTPNSWLSRLLRSDDRADRAEHEAAGDQHQPFAQHQLEDRAGAAAERDADADLASPLGHEIRQHAVDADRRQHSATTPKLSDSSTGDRRLTSDFSIR